MLLALPQFQKEELLASLLIFRCVYFTLPLRCAAIPARPGVGWSYREANRNRSLAPPRQVIIGRAGAQPCLLPSPLYRYRLFEKRARRTVTPLRSGALPGFHSVW